MYREGEEHITYTPVEAHEVSTYAGGIISGGTGDEATIVGNARFLWVYDPNSPDTSGFSGIGEWFCGVPNTPLSSITEEELIRQFTTGERTNLNDFFQAWQELVSSQQPGETDYFGNFIGLLGGKCVRFN